MLSFIEEYWERGWTVVEGVFSAEETDRVAALATGLAEDNMEKEDALASSVDKDDQGRPIPRKVDFPFLLHDTFREFVMSPRLRRIIFNLIRAEPYLVVDQIFMKPPRFGSAKPYHQDNAYFRCHPDDEVITAWIALDDVDESNGCLRYIDGSHRFPILDHHEVSGEGHHLEPVLAGVDMRRESLAPVRKGGVVFHHSKTLHTSHRNTSDRWRRAYATHWVGAGVTSETQTIDNAYFKAHRTLYDRALTRVAET